LRRPPDCCSRRAPSAFQPAPACPKSPDLDTFRGEDGLWSNVNIEEVATPEAFDANAAPYYLQRVSDSYVMMAGEK
jgi:hypothetical protein